MGLILCPKCSQVIAAAIDQCPGCGTPLPRDIPSTAAPQAVIVQNGAKSIQPAFFAVSLFKLAVLSTCTLGLYEIYWFWRNWNRIRVSGKPEIRPSLRAFFVLFYCYPCFNQIERAGINRGVSPAPPMGILAICYILSTLSWNLPGPICFLGFLTVAFLLPIQSYVNRINALASPGHDPNSRFGVWNWITIIAGGLVVILACIGTILPKR